MGISFAIISSALESTQTAVDAVEELGSLQLLREWSCEADQAAVWPLSSSSCILMTCVNPSQNAPENPHHAWVGTKMDGEVITLHCDCMAG